MHRGPHVMTCHPRLQPSCECAKTHVAAVRGCPTRRESSPASSWSRPLCRKPRPSFVRAGNFAAQGMSRQVEGPCAGSQRLLLIHKTIKSCYFLLNISGSIGCYVSFFFCFNHFLGLFIEKHMEVDPALLSRRLCYV